MRGCCFTVNITFGVKWPLLFVWLSGHCGRGVICHIPRQRFTPFPSSVLPNRCVKAAADETMVAKGM